MTRQFEGDWVKQKQQQEKEERENPLSAYSTTQLKAELRRRKENVQGSNYRC